MIELKLQQQINDTISNAKALKFEFITVEHLLLALLNMNEVINFLQKKQVNIDKLKIELNQYIDDNVPKIAGKDNQITLTTIGFQRVLQRSIVQTQLAEKQVVNALNVLASIFAENESQAVYLLKLNNISKLDVMSEASYESIITQETIVKNDKTPQENILNKYAINLNRLAEQGKIDPLFGRDYELTRIMQILARRNKNNPIIVGEAGVGKTALARGVALKIVQNKVPDILSKSIIYSLDVGLLVAGTKYRGDFEKRLKDILNVIKDNNNIILFIDEIHTIIGAGNSGDSQDAANLLKPALADGSLKCIGSTTTKEYRQIFIKDSALSRRFQKIDVKEPTEDETVLILQGLKKYYQDYHSVNYSDDAIQTAVKLANKYINDRRLPDKAIDIIDEAGAYQQIQNTTKRKIIIDGNDIAQVISDIIKIPSIQINKDDRFLLKNLSQNLKLSIFGQNEAIDELSKSIKLAKSGLNMHSKPIGSFLFAGPTGVGKTALCQQLSHTLGVKLLRFDMSEYMEAHAVAKLIGSPPGYVGYEEGGLLTEAVSNNPYAIVLLDEIEKAHVDIFNIFLQVMDNGKLTDSNGREVDFTNILLIMTSNVGAHKLQKNSIGFNHNNKKYNYQEELHKTFTPEFRNRLSKIVYFNELNEMVICLIVDKFIFILEDQLEKKNITLKVLSSARKWLAKNGYNKEMGARPMARLIEDVINTPLADEILFGKLIDGGSVKVDVKKNKIQLKIN